MAVTTWHRLRTGDCSFQFHKRRQQFIRTDDETFSVVAMRVTTGFDELLLTLRNRGDINARCVGCGEKPRARSIDGQTSDSHAYETD
jgi:hypothetical protein